MTDDKRVNSDSISPTTEELQKKNILSTADVARPMCVKEGMSWHN